ncbi:retropepsin-like aspartic protease family protein [Aquipseudomonas ullengensis]|uniref:TIGR02281 family clan AA aspartic protease n=1 Tax=Aquipseudomonas ullengensis TaxID=2759166 RepID=A0A7W4LLE3_9GAMM|nr:TIGR02281 family clan AA aspartic protease [Pseudomonas ullengensis]MBB2495321.1 TIGR02281 family clan AA aspartic protease [Pseudomonas ullengensis]
MSDTPPAGQRAGRVMLICAWIAALALATYWFGNWEERRANPNQQPQSMHGEGFIEVRLASGRGGHYLLDGQIDGQTVTFLLDTGASAVAIPADLAKRLGLTRGAPVTLKTANGLSTGYRTHLTSLQLGEIQLHDVAALITPGMDGDEVLLGMSALKQLEFTQRDGTLVLRQTTSLK